MRIISLVSQKGGTGKTTLALSLAVAFHKTNRNVVLLDLDPQASATEWHDARENPLPHVESLQASRLRPTIAKLRDIGTDVCLIDTAPHSESTALEVIGLSDQILIPVRPSIMDIRAMGKTKSLIDLSRKAGVAHVVMNGVQHHSLAAAQQAAEAIAAHVGLPIAPRMIHDRVAHNRCLIGGLSAQEYEPDGKAAIEMKFLARWVWAQLEQKAAAA